MAFSNTDADKKFQNAVKIIALKVTSLHPLLLAMNSVSESEYIGSTPYFWINCGYAHEIQSFN